MKISSLGLKFNPNHRPAGSSEGGQFAPLGDVVAGSNDHHSQKIHGNASENTKSKIRDALNNLPSSHWGMIGNVTVIAKGNVTANGFGVAGLTTFSRVGNIISITISVAESVREMGQTRVLKDVGLTAAHEFGHALDIKDSKLLPNVRDAMSKDFAALKSADKRAAKVYDGNLTEQFAETYGLSFGPKGRYFGMPYDRAQTAFASSVSAMKDALK